MVEFREVKILQIAESRCEGVHKERAVTKRSAVVHPEFVLKAV